MTQNFFPDRLERLSAILQDEIDRKRLPGCVVYIARQGKVVMHQALGWQQPEEKVPMTTDSVFRIYSMTKPITSVAIMMLMEQGKLQLSSPVSRFIPEFAKPQVISSKGDQDTLRPAAREATVHDLLRHTAGISYEFLGASSIHRQYAAARMGTRDRANADFMPALGQLPLISDPGTVWEYSRATDVLGRVIEVASGLSLGEFLKQHIFGPLQMPDTTFTVPANDHNRVAEPFKRDPDGQPLMKVFDIKRPALFESGGGGLAATAQDYGRFMQCMLNRGELDGVRLLGPQTVDFMTADHLGDIPVNSGGSANLLLPGYGFGLGFAVRKGKGQSFAHGSKGLYYWGGLAGTTFFIDPEQQLCATLMLQAPNQREYYRHLFRGLVYSALCN